MDNNTPVSLSKGEIESLLRQARAEGEKNARNIGRPGFLYDSATDRSEKIEKTHHIASWLKAAAELNYGRISELRASTPEFYQYEGKANFNETTAAQGQATVPAVWANDIMLAVDLYGFARRMFNVVPMTTKTVNMSTGTAITGAFVAEGAAATLTDSSNHFTQTTLTAKLCKAALLWTEELEEDAIAALIPYFTRELARGIAKAEDYEAFYGGSAFDGICNVSGVNEVNLSGSGGDSFAEVSWVNLVDLVAAVPTADLDNAIFVMPRTVYSTLRKEASSTVPIWNRESPADLAGQVGLQALGNNVRWTPFGYPAVVVPNDIWRSDGTDTAAVAFGDFSRYAVLGDRKLLTEKTFNEYYNSTALSGQNRVLEISERVAIAYPEPAAFARLHTAS